MLRWLLPLAVLACCEAAPTRSRTPRAKLDTKALPAQLPARGYAIQTFGIGGFFDAQIVDTDARTLRVIVRGAEDRNVDQTIQLTAEDARRLAALAERAWRERQSGAMPDAHDIVQDLFVVDHDDGFHVRGYPIQAYAQPTGRPFASELVFATYALADPVLDPPPAAAPKPPATTVRHAHAIARTKLATPHTDPAVLPKRGAVVHAWGLRGETLIVIDRDAGTMRIVEEHMGEPKRDKTRKLTAPALEALMAAALDAWHEDATGPTPEATDIREDLIVLDDDEAFYLTGHPISTLSDGWKTGRPAAARAMSAIYQAASPRKP